MSSNPQQTEEKDFTKQKLWGGRFTGTTDPIMVSSQYTEKGMGRSSMIRFLSDF